MDQSSSSAMRHKNIQALAATMFKNIQGSSSSKTYDIFVKRPENHRNLRHLKVVEITS